MVRLMVETVAVPGFRRACLPSSIVGFFHGAFQPHLHFLKVMRTRV
jgi:hypothetical protein